ncbi:MAG: hypothetical protein GWO24_09040, partial [Akkermansiaceae bacterium]|nr:hypothetical protein [Akkermansiaceae bacterium]
MVNTMPEHLVSYENRTHTFWQQKHGLFVLRSTIESDRQQPAVLISNHWNTLQAVFVNGQSV